MAVNTRIQLRRGSTAQWAAMSGVLAEGEIGVELLANGLRRFKIGGNSLPWESLPYANLPANSGFITEGDGISLGFDALGSGLNIGVDTDWLNNYLTTGTLNSEQIEDLIGSRISGVSGIVTAYSDDTGITRIGLADNSIELIDITDLDEDLRTFLATPTATNLRLATSGTTGSGNLVFDTNPIFADGVSIQGTLIVNNISADGNPLIIGSDGDDVGISSGGQGGNVTIGASSENVNILGNLKINNVSVTSNASELNLVDGSSAGTIVPNKAVIYSTEGFVRASGFYGPGDFWGISTSGDATLANIGASSLTTTNNVTVGGNLIVHGTTTTVNSTVVNIGDNIIRVNTSGLNTGGFEVFKGGDPNTSGNYESLVWNTSNASWQFSGPKVSSTGLLVGRTLESTVASGVAPIVVESPTLVTNLNADLLDGQHGSYYLNYDNFSNIPTIGNGTLTLGVSGIGLTGSASFSANDTGNTTFTVTSNATPANIPNTLVARNAFGNFTASNITASGFYGDFIGNGAQITSLNASNISTGTLASGLLPNVSVGSTSTGPSSTFVSSVTTDSKGRVTSINTTSHILASTSATGIASFDSDDFSVVNGVVSINVSGVDNNQLKNDRVTIGQTPLILGSTYSAISGVSAANPVVLTYFAIDGGSP
jgi:hypothetical protein